MKLHFRSLGEGEPLYILHGLFGSSDNWQTLAKRYAEHFEVFLIDQRNHGHSPHSDEFNYPAMAEDLLELVFDQQHLAINILGHSMGAKTAMFFAKRWPELIDKMIVADMGTQTYEVHQQQIISGLQAVDFSIQNSRKAVESQLQNFIPEAGMRSFLMKGLYWREKGILDWRMNVGAISRNIKKIVDGVPEGVVDVDTLFLSGEKSNYLTSNQFGDVLDHFENATFDSIKGAGHWLQADQPELFFQKSLDFLLA